MQRKKRKKWKGAYSHNRRQSRNREGEGGARKLVKKLLQSVKKTPLSSRIWNPIPPSDNHLCHLKSRYFEPKETAFRGMFLYRSIQLRKHSMISADLHMRVCRSLQQLLRLNAFKPAVVVRRQSISENFSFKTNEVGGGNFKGRKYPSNNTSIHEITRTKMRPTIFSRLLLGKPGLTHGDNKRRSFTTSWAQQTLSKTSESSTCKRDTDGDTAKDCQSLDSVLSTLNELRLQLQQCVVDVSVTTESTKSTDMHNPRKVIHNQNVVATPVEFNQILVNYFPGASTRDDLINDPYCAIPGCAMVWHRDKGLVKNSNVFVYCHEPNEAWDSNEDKKIVNSADSVQQEWRVGCKVAWDVDNPAILFPVYDGDAYLMKDGFNEAHQHAVFAGSRPRFSLAFATAPEGENMFNFIESECIAVRKSVRAFMNTCARSGVQQHSPQIGDKEDQFPTTNKAVSTTYSCVTTNCLDVISQVETCRDKIEFGWLRQFWLQGERHSRLKPWWTQRIVHLENKYWNFFNQAVGQLQQAIIKSCSDKSIISATNELIQTRKQQRKTRRDVWQARYNDSVYIKLPPDCKPIDRPDSTEFVLE